MGSTLSATIPDAFAYSMGAAANTIYFGWDPASVLSYTATVSGGSAPYSYSWTADPAIGFFGSPVSSTAQISSSTAGTYTLMLTVTDASGCSTKVSKTINVVDVRSGASMSKVTLCHYPAGNPNMPSTISVSPNAVANMLGSGAFLGPCPVFESKQSPMTDVIASDKKNYHFIDA